MKILRQSPTASLDSLTDLPTSVLCSGFPERALAGPDAEAQIRQGCTTCTRVAYHPDGTETVYKLQAH